MAFTIAGSSKTTFDRGTFDKNPDKKWEGAGPAPADVSLGGWTRNDVMQFCVIPARGYIKAVGPGQTKDSVDVTLMKEGSGDGTQYFEVTTGADSRITEWSISFDVYSAPDPDVPPAGKWVFSKGSSNDDKKA
jgi:hypothetical protein